MSHILSETGIPLTAFVNLCQTPQERRDKYAICREMGVSHPWARRMRDWHWTKLSIYLQAFTDTAHHVKPLLPIQPARASHTAPSREEMPISTTKQTAYPSSPNLPAYNGRKGGAI